MSIDFCEMQNTFMIALLKRVFVLLTGLFLSFQSLSQAEYTFSDGTFTDSRDGQTYKTINFKLVKAGGATVERTWFAENLNYNVKGSYCYKDEPAYCEKFGRLYNYKEAIEGCPEGWHLPTIDEWINLFDHFGGRHEAGQILIEGGGSNMHMLYGGFGEPGHIFKDITISGNWWDSERKGGEAAGVITLEEGTGEIFHEVIGDYHRLSSRCVKFHSD